MRLSRMAKEELGAKAITLATIANEECRVDSPRRIAMKRPIPTVCFHFMITAALRQMSFRLPACLTDILNQILKITNQDWYSRRGYVVYGRKEAGWVDVDDTGKEWVVSCVFLRKDLV